MAFAQHCEQGHGHAWRGILFRQTYPQLADVISKTKEWLPRIFGERVRYNEQRSSWAWDGGEELLLRHMKDKSDYWSYHGHCVDEGEVLTPAGWRDTRDVQVGDPVMTVTKDRRLVTTTIERKTEEWYEGDLVRHEGRGTYFSATPDHKFGAVTPQGVVPTPYTALGRDAVIARHVIFDGGSVPTPLKDSSIDWCSFMG